MTNSRRARSHIDGPSVFVVFVLAALAATMALDAYAFSTVFPSLGSGSTRSHESSVTHLDRATSREVAAVHTRRP